MNRKKESGRAFPLLVLFLVLGSIQTAFTVLIISTASPSDLSPPSTIGLIGMCLVFFLGATVFYWEHKSDQKYDVLIEQEGQELRKQLQEQASNQN